MSRNRKQDTPGEQMQYWHSAVSGLRTLTHPQDAGMPQRFQHAMREGATDESVPSQARDDALAQLEIDEATTFQEISTLETVMGHLDVLLALQTHHSPPPSSSHTPAAAISSASLLAGSTSSASAPATALPPRLKVHNNSTASAPSPANHAPAASPVGTTSRQASLTRSSPAPAQYGTPGSSTGSRGEVASTTKKGRGPGKANLLEKGRRVAYKAEGDDEWLLFRVIESSRDGKGKDPSYMVRDVDEVDEHGRPTVPIQATLRRLIPLPDPTASLTHPSHPSNYPELLPGTTVLGLYPDTTSFYRCVIHSRDKLKASGSGGNYKVKFEDDGDQVRTMAVGDVVGVPK